MFTPDNLLCYFSNKINLILLKYLDENWKIANITKILKIAKFWKLEDFENCKILKIARFWKLQNFENCKILKILQIAKFWKLQNFENFADCKNSTLVLI